MKKIISVLLVLMFIFSLSSTVGATSMDFNITDAVIVVGKNASVTDLYAAEKLEYYLQKITGKDIAVITDDSEVQTKEIVVGETNRAPVGFENPKNGSYVIKSDADKLVIAGYGTRGTIYGVYGFLEDYCGCRWYETNIIKIPENAELTVESGIDVKYTPYFEYTETDTASSRDAEFSIANGQSGGVYRDLSAEQGDDVGYIGNFAHTLVTYYCNGEKYFAEHPEYFALHGGKRVPDQLCLTNPDTIDVVYNEVIELLEREHVPEKSMQIVSLTQHDNQLYCECENCAALDNENGSHAGTMINFVNTIAERVKATGKYDNIVFDTFAYQYTRKTPTKVVPREDVIVRLCSIECCFGHTLDDAKCELNVDFMKDLSDWGKICDRVYIWDYVNNYSETCCIFPNFGVMQRNVQIFAENNVKGVYEEGNYYIADCDAEFAEMRTYLLSQLLKDPYMDYEAEMIGYLEAVYGPGGRHIKEFLDIMTEHAVTNCKHLSIYQKAEETLYGMKRKDIKRCDELWQMAYEEAQTDAQVEEIRRSELSWRYWKCANHKVEFSRLRPMYEWMTAQDALYDDLVEMNIKVIGEGTRARDLSTCEILHYIRAPFKWSTLYDEVYWDFIDPYFMKFYGVLEKIYYFFR